MGGRQPADRCVRMVPSTIFTTVWFAGVPYYYANDTYYVWNGEQQEYEVVQPTADSPGTTQPPSNGTLFVFPKNGQSSE